MNKNTIKPKSIRQSSLEKWYSEIVSKDENDYSVEDICRMLRQDYLVERAVQIGIEFLKKDPFVGNVYNGELLSAFINDQKSYIYVYRKDFEIIRSVAHNFLTDKHILPNEIGDVESIEETKQLVIRLDKILNGEEANLHLELIPQIINKHFNLVSIGTNLANPDYKWRRIPNLPIIFDEKCAKLDVKQLNKVLKSFSGKCKWFLQRDVFLYGKENLYFLTIRERYFSEIYKMLYKKEVWEAAIEDILPLAEHLEKNL